MQKLLEIPEHPEFLISNSNCSDLSSANFNNFFQFLNNNTEDINTKISVFSAFLNRSTCNNKDFEILKNCSDHIENELSSIRRFEKLISLKDNFKNKLKDSSNINVEINKKNEDVNEMQEKVNHLESLYEEIKDKIASNYDREENLKNLENLPTENIIKDRIKQLKVIF